MPDTDAREDVHTKMAQPSASAIWPPPPRGQLQTVPINVLAPVPVFVFYFSRVVMAGALVGGVSLGLFSLLSNPLSALIGLLSGGLVGFFLGIPEGIFAGLLAAILHTCSLSSNTVGRILCWTYTIVNAVIALAISIFMLSGAGRRGDEWALVVSPVVTSYLIWKASRFIATQFVSRF